MYQKLDMETKMETKMDNIKINDLLILFIIIIRPPHKGAEELVALWGASELTSKDRLGRVRCWVGWE